ncbi:hypothetical protein FJTKL_07349 [Diaporthe vaccinii]|uniref:BTB domain-containing protein n=1 Tax=Diaporthe vaccinii TaxID=105482 RepID=A0ABR4EV15_9PEZI
MAQHKLYLLESGNFSDAEIVCKGETWKVHSLILRSRCIWFDKAFMNDCAGEQAGRIHLEAGQPEQITELLKFIYTGRYLPAVAPVEQCIAIPALEGTIDLWCLADSLGLSELKAEIQNYLLVRLSATLCFIHAFRLYTHEGSPALRRDAGEQDDLSRFLDDFSKGVIKVYKNPASRPLQKMLAVFACGLQERLPADVMWDLMRSNPKFQQDVSVVLISLHFPGPTNQRLTSGLAQLCVAHARAEQDTDWRTFRCSGCNKKYGSDRDGGEASLTLDPFSRATRKWCDDCAFWSMNSIMKTMIRSWPVEDSDQS